MGSCGLSGRYYDALYADKDYRGEVAGRVMATFVDESDFKLTRMAVSRANGTLYDTDFHYLLATPQGVQHFSERHQLRMYTHAEYRSALEGAGFVCSWEPDLGIRGMYLGHLERS